mmetsp:Transcript_75128/g.208063  ORF Transcript_75128/g.208063 Transcript_75128/m.208063 type:complete len:205 (+) Transcript_75128:152-766(+)
MCDDNATASSSSRLPSPSASAMSKSRASCVLTLRWPGGTAGAPSEAASISARETRPSPFKSTCAIMARAISRAAKPCTRNDANCNSLLLSTPSPVRSALAKIVSNQSRTAGCSKLDSCQPQVRRSLRAADQKSSQLACPSWLESNLASKSSPPFPTNRLPAAVASAASGSPVPPSPLCAAVAKCSAYSTSRSFNMPSRSRSQTS